MSWECKVNSVCFQVSMIILKWQLLFALVICILNCNSFSASYFFLKILISSHYQKIKINWWTNNRGKKSFGFCFWKRRWNNQYLIFCEIFNRIGQCSWVAKNYLISREVIPFVANSISIFISYNKEG